MDTYFADKVAVVTGAGGVICSQISRGLAELGMTVLLVGRTADKIQKVEWELNASGGKSKSFVCDVADEKQINALAEQIIAEYGRTDYLINGAGGNDTRATPSIARFDPRELEGECSEKIKGLYHVDMAVFENVVRINTMGTVYPILAFARYMVKEEKGSIINFASMNSYCPLTRNFAYAMSKAAVVNLTQSFAAYFGETGVRINAIAPGFVVNERTRTILGSVEDGLTERGQHVINHTPMRKFGQAQDMFGCIKWLIDDRYSSFVTGVTIPVDGGFLALSGV